MGVKALKKALKNANTDDFEVGTVIRWTASGKYTYAAVKSPVGWFTTAAHYNTFVPQIVSYDVLIKVLSKAEVSDVEVAVEWAEIRS